MKPVNWISATGRKPCAASPTDSPAIAFSASGVSRTRSGPKRFKSPSVARNTPPSAATSSPRTRTLASSAMAWVSARLTAWTSVISGTGASLPHHAECGPALVREFLGQGLVGKIEDRFQPLRRGREIGLCRHVDLRRDLRQQPLLVRLGPHAAADEMVSQPGDRVFGPMRAHLGIAAVAPRVVRRGVVAQPIGQRLDKGRPTAGPRLD